MTYERGCGVGLGSLTGSYFTRDRGTAFGKDRRLRRGVTGRPYALNFTLASK
jgi:hypothetical protein